MAAAAEQGSQGARAQQKTFEEEKREVEDLLATLSISSVERIEHLPAGEALTKRQAAFATVLLPARQPAAAPEARAPGRRRATASHQHGLPGPSAGPLDGPHDPDVISYDSINDQQYHDAPKKPQVLNSVTEDKGALQCDGRTLEEEARQRLLEAMQGKWHSQCDPGHFVIKGSRFQGFGQRSWTKLVWVDDDTVSVSEPHGYQGHLQLAHGPPSGVRFAGFVNLSDSAVYTCRAGG